MLEAIEGVSHIILTVTMKLAPIAVVAKWEGQLVMDIESVEMIEEMRPA